MINRKFFFDTVREKQFGGQLSQSQVDGMSTILNEWEENLPNADDRWLAYMLATAFHETARTMQPIREFGGPKYFFRMYDKDGERPQVAKDLGNTKAGDGVKFHGRGFVQLTGRANYKKMKDLLNVDLIDDPDLAMDTEVASNIMFKGMNEGLFTGKKLSDYFNDSEENWFEARRIINKLDKAEMIEGYALTFYAATSYTTG